MSKEDCKTPSGTPAERIMEVAADLFFNQGFRATGINEVIAKSGVAKATFYSNFKSKDELCKQYLKGVREEHQRHALEAVANAEGAVNRYMAPLRSLAPWLQETDFRGCPFVNIAAEIPDFDSPLRREGVTAYDGVNKLVAHLCQELIDSDPVRYGDLEAKDLAMKYMVIFAGVTSMCEIYSAIWPVRQGEEIVLGFIGEPRK